MDGVTDCVDSPANSGLAVQTKSADLSCTGTSTGTKSENEGISGNNADKVAKHYNELEECGRDKRLESRIFYLRNFNNWIKSMLIGDALDRIKSDRKFGQKLVVLDICCGKGGDLLKWKKGDIHHLICADIAGTSVEQCRNRYEDMLKRNNNRLFSAEFITADCTKTRLKDLYKSAETTFDLVSCQFSFHYCFESLAQADKMLQNVSECLKPNGYFIGTTPDAYSIVQKLRASETNSFGNTVYRITFPDDGKDQFPLFGACYNFHLEGVVDCPEFLVYFATLEKLAAKHGMKLVYRKTFPDYFSEKIQTRNGRELIERMKALETYPSEQLVGDASHDYEHVKSAMKEGQSYYRGSGKYGTLSEPEWEAASLYLVFVFKKLGPDTGASN